MAHVFAFLAMGMFLVIVVGLVGWALVIGGEPCEGWTKRLNERRR